jgi:glycosyltransferase involved in cell wall biosynthesis
MKDKTFSVITIVFNDHKNIEQTIQSVLSQKKYFDDFEYIVVDGASQDGTFEIIQKYSKEIDRIISEKDRGISDAFNKGVKNSTGKWINFLNSGDTFFSEKTLFEVSKNLDEKYDFIFGKMNFISEKNEIIRTMEAKFDDRKFFRIFRVLHQSTFHNQKYFEEFGLFDEKFKYVMDLELLLRKKSITYKYVEDVWANLLVGGVSQQDIKNVYEEVRLANKKNKNFSKFELFIIKWRYVFFHYLHKFKSQIFGH